MNVEGFELVGGGGMREGEETMSEGEGRDVERGGGGREGGEVRFDQRLDRDDVRGAGGGKEGGAVGAKSVKGYGLKVSVALAGACLGSRIEDTDGRNVVDEPMPGTEVLGRQQPLLGLPFLGDEEEMVGHGGILVQH